MENIYTHAELITKGINYLKRICSVVASDVVHGYSETPDVIGFSGTGSVILIEAKSSRSDFLADKKKHFRNNPGMGIGIQRYYICNPDIVSEDDLPDGWGLLIPYRTTLKKITESQVFHERNIRAEQSILISLLRRIGQDAPPGVAINCYTYETKDPKATLGISKE